MSKKLFAVLLSVQVAETTRRDDLVEMLTESAKAKAVFQQLGITVLLANAQEISNEEYLAMALPALPKAQVTGQA
jgi:hypothetical protein